jgi:hypothetical protein
MTDEQTPDLTTPEGRAQSMVDSMANTPNVVPDKFKNADGSLNTEALLKSYTELERQRSGGAPDPTPAPNVAAEQPAPEAGAPDAGDDESITDILTKKDPEPSLDWDSIRSQIRDDGKLAPETLKALKEAGIPEDLVNAAVHGAALQAQAQMARAAELVGGKENLTSILQWARETYDEPQRVALAEQLSGPMAETVLRGLHQAFEAAKPGTLVNTAADGTGGLSPTTPEIQPYRTFGEMKADMNKPEYQYDPDFQNHVAKRCAAGGTPAQ